MIVYRGEGSGMRGGLIHAELMGRVDEDGSLSEELVLGRDEG